MSDKTQGRGKGAATAALCSVKKSPDLDAGEGLSPNAAMKAREQELDDILDGRA